MASSRICLNVIFSIGQRQARSGIILFTKCLENERLDVTEKHNTVVEPPLPRDESGLGTGV